MLPTIGLRVVHEDTRPLRPDTTAFATRRSIDVASVSGEALTRLASHGAPIRDGPGDSGLFNDTLAGRDRTLAEHRRGGRSVRVAGLRRDYRVWLVDLADGEPLIGFAPVATGNEDWLAKADEIMNSAALSERLATQSSVENVFAQPAGSYTVECFSLGQLSLDIST